LRWMQLFKDIGVLGLEQPLGIGRCGVPRRPKEASRFAVARLQLVGV
jgi:hypothetical protein